MKKWVLMGVVAIVLAVSTAAVTQQVMFQPPTPTSATTTTL